MKMSKKIVALAAAAAMVVTAVPVSQSLSEVKAAAFEALALYDFESGTGMSSSGIGGSAPTTVSDSARGSKVLQFADGSQSEIITAAKDSSLEEHSYRIAEGSPSSLKFTNPFKGKKLSGATIAMWVKVPTEKAAGIKNNGDVDETLNVASGLVGFVDSESRTLMHPDAKDGGHSDQKYSGRTFIGITAQPCVYFTQIHHNNYASIDTNAAMADFVGEWKYLAVAITNDGVTCYIDGEVVKGSEVTSGKRFKSNEEHDNIGNDGMPYLLDFLSDNMGYTFGGVKYSDASPYTVKDANSKKDVSYGTIKSNVSGYVGFTGFSGTQAGVCIDDLAFFDKAYSASEMKSLFQAAQSGDISVKGEEKPVVQMDEKEAQQSAESIHVASGDINLTGVTAIMATDAAYAALKAIVDGENGVSAIVASNADWNGLKVAHFQMYDITFTGSGELEGDLPSGWDANSMWVLYIDEAAGTVTKVDSSVADGKIRFAAQASGKYMYAEMKSSLPQTGVVSTGLFVLFGASAVAGGSCMLKRKKED